MVADKPDGPITRSRLADLGIRIASAVVLGPVALGLAWIGGAPFAVISALAGMIITWEWNGITRSKRRDPATIAGLVAVAASVAVLELWGLAGALGVLAIGAVASHLLARGEARLLGAAAGVLYGGLPAIAIVILRSDSTTGLICIFWLFAVVWAGDVAAYFVGRLVGGPKLWPAVSPNKTWSGAIGGTAGAVAASYLVMRFAPSVDPVPVILPIVLSAVAQLGDLAESSVKRRFGAKDSSRLIPGHGGVMDRVDGLIAAVVAGAVIGVLRFGADRAAGGLILW